MSLWKYQEWPFWIVSEQLVFTWTGDRLKVVTYQHCVYSSFLLGEMFICIFDLLWMGRREGIQLFGNAVSKKRNRMEIGKKKHLFIFLADLQIPVKECLQYDSKIKIPTTECGENVIFLLCLFLQL